MSGLGCATLEYVACLAPASVVEVSLLLSAAVLSLLTRNSLTVWSEPFSRRQSTWERSSQNPLCPREE